ncbi:unnamed protein product [Cyclocybe aegerita]|uniref:Uncharacterized protein n=1 Tax=Cyclocybe aegerita TaxID=1973307 RepID=A0A8S0VRS3_CYCAE|nr:unnamed protein product [Cyclocybe aegerita]
MVPVTYDPIVDHQRLGEQPRVGANINMFNDDLINPDLWEMADAPMPPQSPPPSASPPLELSPHPPISLPRPLSPPAPPSLLVESPGIMAPTQAVSLPSPVLPSASCGSGTGTSPGLLRPTRKLAPVPSNLPTVVPEADPHPLMSSKPRSRHSENIPTMPIVGGRHPVKPTAKAIAAKEQQEAAQRCKRALLQIKVPRSPVLDHLGLHNLD